MLTGMTGQIEAGGEEVQRHGDAVVEEPFLGVGDVDRLHYLGNESLREISVAGCSKLLDPEPAGVFDRAVVEVSHTDGEARHVVHEEVGEVLCGDDDHCFRAARFEVRPHVVKGGGEGFADLGIGQVFAAGDARGVTADAGVHKWHQVRSPSPSKPVMA